MFVKIGHFFLELELKLQVFVCADASLLKYCHCQDLLGIAPDIPGLILPSGYGGNIEGHVPPLPFMSRCLAAFRGATFSSQCSQNRIGHFLFCMCPAKRVTLPHHGITYGDTEYHPKAEGLYQLKIWLHLVL